jgi:predicted RNase H-like HicB family nuclease/DNA-binding XRE family transcriptional regulator
VTQEDGAFLVLFPSCPGCQTQADTRDEILPMAQEALEGWLEATMAVGDTPPVPPKAARAPKGSKLLWVEVPPKLAVKIELRWARHHAQLTQAQLAKLAHVSQQQIAQLESPDSNPTLDTLEKVARALGSRLQVSISPEPG